MSMNLRLRLKYETGKPSRRIKSTIDVDLIQIPTNISYEILGKNNKNLLEPTYSYYAKYVVNVLGEDAAKEHLEPIAILIDEYRHSNLTIEWSVS
jgi:hypothetical protein